MTFDDLRLAEPIVRAVASEGYTTPTPIQKKAIPATLTGRDVLGCAQTGTGKTGAFALPILHRLARRPGAGGGRRRGLRDPRPRALVLCPTRELASQIDERFTAYGRNLPLRSTVVFGGVSQHHQVNRLRAGVDVLVATPGRLLDLLGQGCVDLAAIEILVLDEADRMLDMGFIRDIRKIVERVPAKRQTLLFSATMPADIRRLADSILTDPIEVKAAPVAAPADAIEQSVFHVARQDKPKLLEGLLRREAMERTLIFTRTKHGADKLVRVLRRAGIESAAIHGNKSQNARTRALDGFKSGRHEVLIATDIAARGIDVERITHVINYDVPNVPETYVHRIGRTARAGTSGIAMSFCDHEEVADLRVIERLIARRLEIVDHDLAISITSPPPASTDRGHERRTSRGNGNGSGNGSGSGGGGRRRRRSRNGAAQRGARNGGGRAKVAR